MQRRLVGIAIFLAALLIAAFWYASRVNVPLLEPAGPIAAAERTVILETFALSALVVIPVFFLLFYFAWRYRDQHPDAPMQHRPDWDHESRIAEFSWWLAPIAIVGVLSVIAWQSSHALDPWNTLRQSQPLEVQVVALEWKWLFIYPNQGIATVNELMIPVGTPVHFDLSADAPMNSFWIPQLGGQIMDMPGMSTQLSLQADRAGTFTGYSANISGEGFAGMTFAVKALQPSDFQAWVRTVQAASSTPLTLESFRALERPSAYDPVRTYTSVESGLYNRIVDQYMTEATSTHMQ